MSPRSRRLDPEEIRQLIDGEDESWQERLAEIAREESYGFKAEIVPAEIEGYEALDPGARRKAVQEAAHALFNAVRHRLAKATRAVDEAYEWNAFVAARRSEGAVIVHRRAMGGEWVPLPPEFRKTLLSLGTRQRRADALAVRRPRAARLPIGDAAAEAPSTTEGDRRPILVPHDAGYVRARLARLHRRGARYAEGRTPWRATGRLGAGASSCTAV